MLEHASRSEFNWQEKVVFAYIDEPPFAWPGTDGRPAGCDVEIALTILKAIGVRQVETRLVTFTDLLPGVMAGRWTMTTALFVTVERSRWVDFSRPIWALSDGFIMRTGNPKVLINYEALAADDTARLGVVKDTVQRQTALNAGIPVDRIVELATQDEVVAALLAGQVDVYASTAMGHRAFVRRAGDARLAVVDLVPANTIGERTAPVFGAFAFAKSNGGLRQVFDLALKAYLGSAEHSTLMARYGFTNADIDRVVEQH